MNSDITVRSERCFVWAIAAVTKTRPIRSPAFFFAKRKWCFELSSLRSQYSATRPGLYLSMILMHTGRSNVINNDSRNHFIVGVQATYRFNSDDYSDSPTRKAIENFCFAPDNYREYFQRLYPSDNVTSMEITFNFSQKIKFFCDGVEHNVLDEHEKQDSQCKDNLIDDIKGLLTDSSLCDIELKCKDGRSIKAHKAILSARSQVFKAMLLSDMEESRSGVVKIPDMDLEMLKLFLRYIYSADLPGLTADAAKQLYEAGDKYGILCLKKTCAEFLVKNFSAENVCDLLVTADLHSDENFKEKAVAYILKKKIPCRKESWSGFIKSHPHLAAEVLTKFYEAQNQNVWE